MTSMFGRNIRLGRIAGIPIGVSPWWIAIVALFTWTLGSGYFPEAVHGISPALSYALGLASVLLLFASLLLHEFGHAIVARRHGVEVEEIDLWLLGGVSKLRGEAREPGDELRYALAGPGVSAVVTAFWGVLLVLLPNSSPASVLVLVEYQLLINALILAFNLLPAFPLDGGRALRALLWRRSGSIQRATAVAAAVGRVFGYGLAALGVFLLFSSYAYNGVWLVLVGFFIATAASQQAVGAEVRGAFSGKHADDLMALKVVCIPADLPLERAASDYVARFPYTAFPVVDHRGRALGLVTADRVREALGSHSPDSATHAAARVADVSDRDPALLIGEEEDLAVLLERPAFGRVGRAVVVDAGGRAVGLVSITDVERALRSTSLRAGAGPQRVAR